MKKLFPEDKRVLIAGFSAAAAMCAIVLFVLLPLRAKINIMKKESAQIQTQIHDITSPPEKKNSAWRDKAAFEQKEEESLRLLSDTARKLNFEIISFRPEPKGLFLGADNKKLEIEGKVCQKVSVLMEMKCGYRELVAYLQALKETLPTFFTAEKLLITRNALDGLRLSIALEINLYLLN